MPQAAKFSRASLRDECRGGQQPQENAAKEAEQKWERGEIPVVAPLSAEAAADLRSSSFTPGTNYKGVFPGVLCNLFGVRVFDTLPCDARAAPGELQEFLSGKLRESPKALKYLPKPEKGGFQSSLVVPWWPKGTCRACCARWAC